ncbi:MAG: phosphate ABC transporter permease PstA [Caldimonas sp.]
MLLVSFDENGQTVRDRLASAVVHSLAFVMVFALALVIAFPIVKGVKAMQYWNFYTKDLTEAGTQKSLEFGGIKHAIVGTLEQIAIALSITIPLGLTCAVFLNEIPGRFARLVRTVVEAMTALPSIVAGLFIYASLIVPVFGREQGILPKSGLAAALAISVMMLPIIIRAADVVLRLVSGSLKEASLALGASQWRTVWHVVLPTARSGLMTAIILGAARGLGETSPVLLTAGYSTFVNANPTRGEQTSLPLLAFKLINAPSEVAKTRGYGAAAFLMLIVLVLFVAARTIGGRAPGDLTRAQEHRRVRGSSKDAARFAARLTPRQDLPSDHSLPAQTATPAQNVFLLPEQPSSP